MTFSLVKKIRLVMQPLVREPLVHFLLLGALVFAADAMIFQRKDDPRVIAMGPEVDAEARTLFKTSLGREPSAAELKQLRQRWIDNEVLYREGMLLAVDKGDTGIRERVIFKALNIMQSNLAVPPADDKVLRAWFEKNHATYDEPPRYDFVEAVWVGDKSDAVIKKFVNSLSQGVQDATESGLRVFKGRPQNNLRVSYGEDFVRALDELPPGEWRSLLGKDGAHVVRLEARHAGVPTSFEAVQARVYPDWKDAIVQQLRTDAVRELGKKYRIESTAKGAL